MNKKQEYIVLDFIDTVASGNTAQEQLEEMAEQLLAECTEVHNTFKIEFETGNQAFKSNDNREIIDILNRIVQSLSQGNFAGNIRDSDGNTVGYWAYNGQQAS